ncbi:MAG: hypothetical protein GC201_11130 [Alphaproteobacteria bacterium]|nr:hypothetical protein [Alphaproteobacteria bacterium]
MQEVVIPCPECRAVAYKAPTRPPTMAEIVGTACPECGHRLTKAELQRHFQEQILKEAAALLARMPKPR